MMQRARLNASALLASLEAHLAGLERRHRAASISWHFERDLIPYVETDLCILESNWPRLSARGAGLELALRLKANPINA